MAGPTLVRQEALASLTRSSLPVPRRSQLRNKIGLGLALGAGIGTALGAAYGNVGMGVALGVGMGVAVGAFLQGRSR